MTYEEKLARFNAHIEDGGKVETEGWMPDEDWRACAGDVLLRADEPVYACVRIAHDNRSAAVEPRPAADQPLPGRARHLSRLRTGGVDSRRGLDPLDGAQPGCPRRTRGARRTCRPLRAGRPGR